MPQTAAAEPQRAGRWQALLAALPEAGLPALLHGLRFAAAVSLALYAAFALQLDNPSWAGTSAATVCLPILGASLRKAFFRLVGTAVGAVATVLLTACFPQDRLCFLLGLAFWCGCCGFAATLLRNFAAYAAMLAGYTMAIIASDSIALPDQVFLIAVTRAAEIGIGILSATLVLAVGASGRAHRDLGLEFANLISDTLRGFGATLGAAGGPLPDSRPLRRRLIRRAAALDALIDQAAGEATAWRRGRPRLQAAMDGIFGALAGWRIVAGQMAALPEPVALEQARALVARLPPLLRGDVKATGTAARQAEACRSACAAGRRQLLRLKTGDVSLRLLADATAQTLGSLAATCEGLLLIADPAAASGLRRRRQPPAVADVLPALVNGLRVFAGVAVAALFWIVTAWPSGPLAITFTAVTLLLLAPRQEEGLGAALGFGLGTSLAAGLAAIVNFAVLPNQEGFVSFAGIIAAVLVPLAALSTAPTLAGVFGAAAINVIPLLGPTNAIRFDTAAFYNSTLAIMSGCLGGAVLLRLVPPVAASERARRLVDLTLKDLRRLAAGRRVMRLAAWQALVHARLVALPESSGLGDGARLVAALTLGTAVIGLRRLMGRIRRRLTLAGGGDPPAAPDDLDVEPMLQRVARGDAAPFAADLANLEQALAALQEPGRPAAAALSRPALRDLLRARAAVLILRGTQRGRADAWGAGPP